MTKNQRIVYILISIFSVVALVNGIQLALTYYHLASIGNIESSHFIELSQTELMSLSKEQLVELLSSYMELSQDKYVTSSTVYDTVFYIILALVLALNVSVLYNWWLVKNTHNKSSNSDAEKRAVS
jgi:hypothetical protein